MKKVIAIASLAIMLSGCAALQKFPQRTEDMWNDPVRREHFITQVGLEFSTASMALTCAIFVPFPFSLAICPAIAVLYNFVTYEFILEPLSEELVEQGLPSKVGPYWERGPKGGEVFRCDILIEHCDRWPYILAPSR